MADLRIIILAPALLIVILVMAPVIEVINIALFDTIDSSTSVFYGNLIKLLAGSMVLVMILGIIYNVWESTQRPTEYSGGRYE